MMTAIEQLQPQLTTQLAQTIVRQQVAHAYLMVGEDQSQTVQLGLWFIQALFCQDLHAGYPCKKCNHCRRIAQNNFPDVLWLTTTKASLGVDEVRPAKLEMEQSGLESSHRALVVQAAEKLTNASANSLLKFLEDPTGQVATVLLATNSTMILPTILSRVQILRLANNVVDQTWQAQLQKEGYSTQDIQILAAAHLDNDLTANLAATEFDQLKKLLQHWFDLLWQQPQLAFVEVGAKINKQVNQRPQQKIWWCLLEHLFSQALNQAAMQQTQLAQTQSAVEYFLQAKTYWKSNVSFENSLEYLALSMEAILQRS